VDKSFRYGGYPYNDRIIAGDWQGTGTDGIAIFRPASGYWFFDYNLDGIVDKSFRFGGSGDQIIKGDWLGEGTDRIAIFRPSSGYWYFDFSLDGTIDHTTWFGGNADQIIQGDWKASGRDRIAIFRPLSGDWFFDYYLDGTVDKSFRYGGNADQIIAGKWNYGPYPVIRNIIPDTGTAGSVISITDLMGNNFQSGATVTLMKSGNQNITATNVNVQSSSMITCTLSPASDTTPGPWDVVVTNPDGHSGIYTNLFTIYVPIFPTITPTPIPTTIIGTASTGPERLASR